ncbi:MAG: EAL domain-containing protein [Lachnospiraceae bacterium]|nr:EAL domain-containing protein [Lachnospiraceae bacterium]
MQIFEDHDFIKHATIVLNYLHNGVACLEINPDNSLKLIYVNQVITKMVGKDFDDLFDLYQDNVLDMLYPADQSRFYNDLISHRTNMEYFRGTYRFQTVQNTTTWALGHFQFLKQRGKDVCIILLTNVNDFISAQIKVEEDYDNMWQHILNNIPIGTAIISKEADKYSIIALNDPLKTFANHVGEMIDGTKRDWNKENLSILLNQSIYTFCLNEDIPLVEKALTDCLSEPTSETTFRLAGSTESNPIYIHIKCSSNIFSPTKTFYYILFTEVTKEVLTEQELQANQLLLTRLSYYDNLTGFKNRNAYSEFTDNAKFDSNHSVGIAFLDANGLKETNDKLGHAYGDRMLQQLANIVKEYVDYTNVYRISGDEFVILEPDADKDAFISKILTVRRALIKNDNIASLGFTWEKDMTNLKQSIGSAEQAMYMEKHKYYASTAASNSKHRPRLLRNLLYNLENGRYVMYLQPKCDTDSYIATGAEALVRFIDKDGSILPPYEFIPQLEREKLIPKIDYFILEEACKYLETLKAKNITDFVVSVNMSRISFEELNFTEDVKDICSKYDFNRNQLEFELTETYKTIDSMRLNTFLKRIKALGISISLDDVGTDYSSLTMLIMDEIDVIKIDRSLITQINGRPAQILLKNIITTAHELGLKVIAEGVETDEVRLLLKDLGCDQYQGYLMSPPIPVEEFNQRFMRHYTE